MCMTKGRSNFHLGSYLAVYRGVRRFDAVVGWSVSHQRKLEMARKSYTSGGRPLAVVELTGFYFGHD